MGRRDALAAASAFALVACGGGKPANPTSLPAAPLRTQPLTGLFPAAGLTWLVDALPASLMGNEAVARAVNRFVSEDRALKFRETHGGIDPRRATQLVVAQYGEDTRVYGANVALDPGRVERAFTQAATNVDARAADRAHGIVRVFGEVDGTRAQVLVLNRDAVALEVGHLGPVRAMEAFAQGKLTHAKPALAAMPLDTLSAEITSPLRAFFRGPFEGAGKKGLGGLLEAATGVGVWLEPPDSAIPGGRARLGVLVHLGLADDTDPRVREGYAGRLRAALQAYGESAFGLLLGLREAKLEPRPARGCVGYTASFDFAKAVDGLYDAVAGDPKDIFKRGLPELP